MDRATLLIDTGMLFNGTAEFSGNGKWLFFQLQQREKPAQSPIRPDTRAALADVWSYTDRFLPPNQRIRQQPPAKTNWAAIDLSTKSIRLLEEDDQRLVLLPNRLPGDIVLVSRPDSDANPLPGARERFTYPTNYYAYYLRDRSRILITKDADYFLYPRCLSPGGRWLLYFDRKDPELSQLRPDHGPDPEYHPSDPDPLGTGRTAGHHPRTRRSYSRVDDRR